MGIIRKFKLKIIRVKNLEENQTLFRITIFYKRE